MSKEYWRINLKIPKPKQLTKLVKKRLFPFLVKNIHWIITIYLQTVGILTCLGDLATYSMGVIFTLASIMFWYIFKPQKKGKP